jgi:hypothetical protein
MATSEKQVKAGWTACVKHEQIYRTGTGFCKDCENERRICQYGARLRTMAPWLLDAMAARALELKKENPSWTNMKAILAVYGELETELNSTNLASFGS